jgi:predicted GIY-YIG superfamily endonuclease
MTDKAILGLAKVSLQEKHLLPEYSGIYYVLDETNIVWYIGQAKNINKRWQGKTHHRLYQLKAQKKKQFTIYYENVSESQLDSIEKQRIEQYHPLLNTSPVKKQKVRPTETLLRETLAAISDSAFILGVEPPRQEIANNIHEWLAKKKVLNLKIIHICLDLTLFRDRFKPESIEEEEGIIKTSFTSRKAYAQKWEKPIPLLSIYRLYVNGYAIEVNSMSLFLSKDIEKLYQYDRTTLAQESIQVLTPESLAQIQQQIGDKNIYIKRLNPYTSDLIEPLFNETIEQESIQKSLLKLSDDYKKGLRGLGSRSKAINVDRASPRQ